MALTIRIEKKETEWETLYFNGLIDEDAEVPLADLKMKIPSKAIFNLKMIQGINSCGVRAWINFMRDCAKNAQAIIYDECPPEIVNQMNMIPNFKGNAQIRSVYASYTCETCDKLHLVLFKEGEKLPKTLGEAKALPKAACPTCHDLMEMEEMEEEFFGWLDQA